MSAGAAAPWDGLALLAERLGRERVEASARRLADSLRETHPELEIRLLGDAVEIRGQNLRERSAQDPALRWPGR